MAYANLQAFIDLLDEQGELIRIKEYVNPELEITEITDRYSKHIAGGKALLFENNGTDFPVLINALGSHKRMSLALGVDKLDDIGDECKSLFTFLTEPRHGLLDKLKILPRLHTIASWMPKLKKGRGACQEVIMKQPDLSKIPILKCWPADGGPFITFPMVITRDRETGIRNVGMYRMQVFEKGLTGMHWHKHKTGARHYQQYKEKGEKMPVAVALGGDPAHTFSATAPLPDNIDEFMLSGFLRKKHVELVKCITNDIEVPADADFIIEGYVDPSEELIYEGPFGDHTGFYSLADYYPKFHVTCITHRKKAIYPATIVGIPPMEDAYIAKATERIFLTPIKLTMVPEMVDYDIPIAGVAHNLAIVSIKKTYPGQAQKVINTMWGAGQMMFNKILIVVDATVDVHDYIAVAQAIAFHTTPAQDIVFSKGPLDVLDHAASKLALGGKMGIDATVKFEEERDKIFESVQIIFANPVNMHNLIGGVYVNDSLMRKGVSLIIVAINKTSKGQVKDVAKKLFNIKALSVKMMLIVDKSVDIKDVFMSLWVGMNNMDPGRDNFILKQQGKSTLVMDGTAKKNNLDGFERDWPNAVISSEQTIKSIDEKWEFLGLGELIESPSVKYSVLVKNEGAVAH